MRMKSWMSAVALSAGLATFSYGQVSGKVTLDGKAPKIKEINMAAVADCAKQHTDPVMEETYVVGAAGELKNVVVYVKKEEGQELGGEVPKTPAVLDQAGCVYKPHVIAVMVGQEFKVRNSDSFLHNVHGLAKDNGEFNFPQQNKGDEKKVEATPVSETYKIKCDVHPWMAAWVVVLDHPFFAVSGDDGAYSIAGLKDGDYTLVAWHEKLGVNEQKISVKGGKASADFKIKGKSAMAEPAGVKEVVLTSTKVEEECCEKCEKGAAVAKDAKPATPQVSAK